MHPIFRRQRRETVGCAFLFLLSVPVFAVGTVWGAMPLPLGAVLCAVGLLGLLVQGMAVRAIPRGLVLVADRPIRAAVRIEGSLLARELEALAGLEPFVDLRVRRGVARHDPEALRAVVESLRTSTAGTGLGAALDGLASALGGIAEAGARCSLISTNAWSGPIEDNLGVFFVTY